MQIVHIVPGSGGSFYCGNCLRDSKYMQGLKQAGIEVIKVPMYLPIFADEHDIEEIPVFYGAISLYLKHSIPILRKAPAWVDKILNSGPALKFAARMAGSTNPKGLEDMTISMLLGESGEQKEELDHLVNWLEEHAHADIIHLSNALLIGLAKRIKERLDVKVVCSLQDEDVWVNAMDEDFKNKTWNLMKERARDVDAFFAVSSYFAKEMQPILNIPNDKLFTHHITVDPEDYIYQNTSEKPLNIGYISRMCESNGLEVLVDAFILLKKDPAWQEVKLIITGGSTGENDAFVKSIRKKIKNEELESMVEFHKDFEDGRHDFFKKVSMISVPVLEGEAFGLYLLESMASGVPVVQPALGAFPEIIKKAGGGIIYESNSAEQLSTALVELLDNRAKLNSLSLAGRQGVEQKFNIHQQAKEVVNNYTSIKSQSNKKKTVLLKLFNIYKSYNSQDSDRNKPVLVDLSMDLDTGETMAILGPSGSGKSTLLNIIGTLDKPDSGEVIFSGTKINEYAENQLADFRNQEIGFVFQSHHLLPQCTVMENVLIPTLTIKDKAYKNECRNRAKMLVKEVGLWDQRDKLPGTLSGGECQRVAVIRALINNPKLLLADEPTGSLDRINAQIITDLLLKLNSEFNTSLIMVTHSEEIGKQMNKTYRLVDGKLNSIK